MGLAADEIQLMKQLVSKKIEEIVNESLERKKKKKRENLKHSPVFKSNFRVRLSDDSTVKGPKSHR